MFSKLILVLPDRTLELSLDYIENIVLLKGNNKLWSQKEINKIIDAAVFFFWN